MRVVTFSFVRIWSTMRPYHSKNKFGFKINAISGQVYPEGEMERGENFISMYGTCLLNSLKQLKLPTQSIIYCTKLIVTEKCFLTTDRNKMRYSRFFQSGRS